MTDHNYELFALAGDRDMHPVWLGDFPKYEDALRARDEDVLSGLRSGGGWYELFEHLIVGPGLAGPRTVHRHATLVTMRRSMHPDAAASAAFAHPELPLHMLDSGPTAGRAQKFPRDTSLSIEISSA